MSAMTPDGYELYEQLKDGEPARVVGTESTYRLQFKGKPYGGENWLEVADNAGTVRKYGYGWNSELVFKALEEIEKSWQVPQTQAYRPMGEGE